MMSFACVSPGVIFGSVVVMGGTVTIPPLSDMARWKRPLPRGEMTMFIVLCAPADSPVMVTLWGLPPKASIFFRIHFRAWAWSRVPKFPESESLSAPPVWIAGW